MLSFGEAGRVFSLWVFYECLMGACEVQAPWRCLASEVPERCRSLGGAFEVPWMCLRGALAAPSRYLRGAVEVPQRRRRHALEVPSRCLRGALKAPLEGA